MTINASGAIIDGMDNGMGMAGGSPTTFINDRIMQHMGDPHEKLQSTGGSQICVDITTQPVNFYMSDTDDSGSSWMKLVSGA